MDTNRFFFIQNENSRKQEGEPSNKSIHFLTNEQKLRQWGL